MQRKLDLRSVLTVLMVTALVSLVFYLNRPETGPFTLEGSGPNGLRALALLLEDLGYEVDRFDLEQLADLVERENAPSAVILTLPHAPITRDEFLHLLDWVETGNALLVLGRSGEVTLVLFQEFRIRPVIVAEQTGDLESHGYLEAIRSLELQTNYRLSFIDEGKGAALVADEFGALVVEVTHGEGRILLAVDGTLHTNRRLGEQQNLDLLLLTLRTAGAQRVYVAEAVDPAAPVEEAEVPAGTPARNLFVVALVASLWAAGRRLGPPRPGSDEDEKLLLGDYISGVARLYQQGRARRYALQILYDDLLSVVAAQTAVSGRAGDLMEKAVVLAKRRGVDVEALLSCLHRCEAALRGEPADEEFIVLANQLEEFRRRLSGLNEGSRVLPALSTAPHVPEQE